MCIPIVTSILESTESSSFTQLLSCSSFKPSPFARPSNCLSFNSRSFIWLSTRFYLDSSFFIWLWNFCSFSTCLSIWILLASILGKSHEFPLFLYVDFIDAMNFYSFCVEFVPTLSYQVLRQRELRFLCF